ncbi:hypothetical protein R83H12_02629 [Fibrobacteria bacterium R8-3-H12]
MGNEVLNLLNNGDTVKILVTVDDKGTPHPVVKNSLRNEGNAITYVEFLESSRTNRYMTKSLWFNKSVSILILTPDEKSWEITALPVRAIVNGKNFQRYYEEAQKKYNGLDIATVWVLQPLEIREGTLQKRVDEESQNRPYFLHLDRLAKNALEAAL